MADEILVEGQGITVTFANETRAIKKLTIPGWVREMIDVTTLANTAVKTKVGATLKEINDFPITYLFSPDSTGTIPEGNQIATVSFPATGSLIFWGTVSNVGDSDGETDSEMTQDITITPTNLNATGVETPPVWAGS